MDNENKRYLTEREVSKIIGRAIQSLRNDRHNGRGIKYLKMGSSVRYDFQDVISFMEARKVETNDYV